MAQQYNYHKEGKMAAEPVHVIVMYEVKDNKHTLDAFLKAALPMVEETNNANGCVRFDLHQDLKNKYRFVLVEEWENQQCLTAHLHSEYVKAFKQAVSKQQMAAAEPGFFFCGAPLLSFDPVQDGDDDGDQDENAGKHVFVMVTYDVNDNKLDCFVEAAISLVAETNKSAGCLRFNFHQDKNDPCRFVSVEEWDCQENQSAHFQADYVKTFVTAEKKQQMVASPHCVFFCGYPLESIKQAQK
jgi:quinol monooxygenase YgiN